MKHHWRHAGRETFCEQFPVGMNTTCATPGRNLIRQKFPAGVKLVGSTWDRKLFKYGFIVMRFRALRFFPQILVRSFFSHQEKKKVRIMATVQ